MQPKEDFKIALNVLRKSKEGVNMNLITLRSPNKIYINDTPEHVFGGFDTHGYSWVYFILITLQGRAHHDVYL